MAAGELSFHGPRLRALRAGPEHAPVVQACLDAAPDYFERTERRSAGPGAAAGLGAEAGADPGLVGGVFLVYLGVKCLLAPPPSLHEDRPEAPGLAQAFLSTLGLTLANPPTILAFAAIFAGLGLVAADYAGAGLVVLGVFLGSAVWWVVLAAAAGWLRGRIGPRVFRAINVVSGLSILGFALWQIATLLR